MKKKRYIPEQAIGKLAGGDELLNASEDLAENCRGLEKVDSTWDDWRGHYGGIRANDAKRL